MSRKPNDKQKKSIGVATMEADGSIVLTMNAGMAQIRYPPDHPDYKKILKHLKGLKPGVSKPITPWK